MLPRLLRYLITLFGAVLAFTSVVYGAELPSPPSPHGAGDREAFSRSRTKKLPGSESPPPEAPPVKKESPSEILRKLLPAVKLPPLPSLADAEPVSPDTEKQESNAAKLRILPAKAPPAIKAQRDQRVVGAQGGFTEIVREKRDPLEPVERPIEEEVILSVKFGRYTLNEGLIAFLHRGGVLLPLSVMAESMDFLINVDLAAGQAEGFFLSEDRTFSLDLVQGKVVVEGKIIPFDRKLVELHEDDIYVDSTLFGKWFPVDLEFNVFNQSITVTAREKLPLEARLERERKHAKLIGKAGRQEENFPLKVAPYKLIDWPFVDNNLDLGYDNKTENLTTTYNTVLSGDLLYLGSTLRLAGSREENLSDARLTMGRQDVYGNLLGPVKATEFFLGDVFSTQIPLVASNQEGAGFVLSTFPIAQQSEFDRINLRGELPQGWQVELYRNEILLDTRLSNADGRYEFLDVPLLFGTNVIRLLFYGPQGQFRESIQTFNVGQSQARPGQQFFRTSVNLAKKDLIPVGDQASATQDDIQGEVRWLFEYERGINRHLSFVANTAGLPFTEQEGGRKYFGTLGFRTGLFGALSRVNFVLDGDIGKAVQFATQKTISGVNVFLEHGQFYNFTSERVLAKADPTVSLSNLRIDGQIPSSFLPHIPFNIGAEVERFESGLAEFRLTNRLSVFWSGVSASNSARFTLRRFGTGNESTTGNGSTQISGRYDKLALRGNFSYELIPEMTAGAMALTADYNFTRDFSVRLSANRQLFGQKRSDFGIGLNRRFDNFAIGVDATYNDQGDFTAGLSISFSIARNPWDGGVELDSYRLATVGGVSTRVFLDSNTNKKFDEGDRPLPGIEFRGGNGRKKVQTDENGVLFLTGMPGNRPSKIKIKMKTLEDPLWAVNPGGYEVITRPGRPIMLDFPVTPTGEVDGTVFLNKGGKTREVSRAKVQLIDGEGNLIKEETTAFDGFYLFTSVPIGQYTLRISPDQIERLDLKTPPEQEVYLSGEEPFLSGMDIVIESNENQENRKISPPKNKESLLKEKPE